MLNHTLIGPLSLATLLPTSDRQTRSILSFSLHTLSSWGILIARCSLSTLARHSFPPLPRTPAAGPFAVPVVSQLDVLAF